jgi:hypothetical protein
MTIIQMGPTLDQLRPIEDINEFKKKLNEMHLKTLLHQINIELEKHNWGSKAVFYGFDEPAACGAGTTQINTLYKMVNEAAPKLRIIFTGANRYLPDPKLFKEIKNIIWCPQLHWIVLKEVESAKARGEEVWWYVCSGPATPYPNLYIDQLAIENRILFPLSFKFGIEGFLYWSVTLWNDNIYEQNGVWTYANGDGFLYYPPDINKKPVGSIRVEQVRDGLEDYDYLTLLKGKISQAKQKKTVSPDVISKAEQILVIPTSIVKSRTEFTRNPNQYTEYRNQIGEMIEKINIVLGEK